MISPVLPIKNSALPPVERRPHIGMLLLDEGKLTQEDIEVVLRAQQEFGLRFGETALRLGLLQAGSLKEALSRQFSYSYLAQGRGNYPRELVASYLPFCKDMEVVRTVRSQLMLNWFSTGRKSLAIVSVQAGDGASLFAANLAIAFSHLGAETLLVDANLRAPRQHHIFDLEGRSGLADILGLGSGMDSILRIGDFPQLSVLPAGAPAPNPQELINRPGMAALNRALGNDFEIVLYDLPALENGADAIAIAKLVGGVLLVARKNRTDLKKLKAFGDQLRRNRVEIVGSVLGSFR